MMYSKIIPFFLLGQSHFKKMHESNQLIPVSDDQHDDRVALDAASRLGGWVVTNNKYRDHPNVQPIKKNPIKYKWTAGNNLVLIHLVLIH